MEKRMCIRCNEVKELKENFEVDKNGVHSRNVCKKCRNERARIYRIKHSKTRKEKRKIWDSKYAQSEKGKITQKKYRSKPTTKAKRAGYSKKYIPQNSEKIKEWKKRSAKKDVDSLGTTYIKRTLIRDTSLKFSDIPENLVELKRKQLKLNRDVKKQKNNSKDNNTKNTKKSH